MDVVASHWILEHLPCLFAIFEVAVDLPGQKVSLIKHISVVHVGQVIYLVNVRV